MKDFSPLTFSPEVLDSFLPGLLTSQPTCHPMHAFSTESVLLKCSCARVCPIETPKHHGPNPEPIWRGAGSIQGTPQLLKGFTGS